MMKDEDDFSRAMESSQAMHSPEATRFGPSDRTLSSDWVMVHPTLVSLCSGSWSRARYSSMFVRVAMGPALHDDQSLNCAIKESPTRITTYNNFATEAYEDLPTMKSVRDGRPVQSRSAYGANRDALSKTENTACRFLEHPRLKYLRVR